MRRITINSQIISNIEGKPVQLALVNLKRDMKKTLLPTEEAGIPILLEWEETIEEEAWKLEMRQGDTDDEAMLVLSAASSLGFVYGIYEISQRFFGVEPFWFWNDQSVTPRLYVSVPEGFSLASQPFRVRLRGWFVNDEVLLHTWKIGGDGDEPWRMVFEALLRLGGNMTIPGTDKNGRRYRRLASDMGLAITHHHAEPLGAEMFARAYPELQASYAVHGDLYRGLWAQALEEQKDMRVVWNLGFRGQGDRPFWEDDPAYNTDEKRGELMGELIRVQYQMVKERHPDAICCTNLYGETMELYQKGCLKLPEDVIYIWADNGFGKMVSRRQENHNPRIPALPKPDAEGKHGIYYHASFYDLQAANHMTMLPNTLDFVERELKQVLDRGAEDYWIVNCSNVKPHVFTLSCIAQLWKTGSLKLSDDISELSETHAQTGGASTVQNRQTVCGIQRGTERRQSEIEAWARDYACRYFGAAYAEEIAKRYLAFGTYAIQYGPNEDDHAGEQFWNHVPRILMTQFMRNRSVRAEELRWACDGAALMEQVSWYQTLCEEGVRKYGDYVQRCEMTAWKLSETARTLFEDSLLLQVRLLFDCCEGALSVCRSLLYGFAGDYQRGFYYAGQAAETFARADERMRRREHGKWIGYYQNECLADVKQSGWVAEQLMGYLRALGDGPHYYQWQQEFLHTEADRRVLLILNMENHLRDQELYMLMKARWAH